ncbi:MAG: UvrD-helicase domain-containing protein [Candidatus Thiodiazotropha sp. (ex Lucinoma aequizonata)]|nr:UvrD-helicase domain-containing protein [Candidatus Thiodiazotropha sp. (ex Lucinoma aequizonata)]MCU7888568.1 UvrD-helicase domain-containing protein [Candidatus Thiodiazotropha sp. (ex Lucinoma aequizonata)]MCU7895070.1 UvrD-helicase domain-containing protein [Candidatus Thiodiazotropha sp. (ex Lucinoma aequizonata)]MCU7897212.1 UvrD-helicase domain-containing protein [Candidatus Thiodiazotropha sp. (ex Lucinoma aequizonata)]MCU7903233.1 UvrD-helicase domain-containing protein [Candidatus 
MTIVPAGAGSGKTYTIQQQLSEWVVEGKIAPERIVAVTFTEAAAAELRERIRAILLELGHLEDALRLDQAYISTIHGFGLRLLTEFAFDSGLSPKPRLLNEDEENTLIRLALARTDKADVVTSNLAQYGYKYDYNSGKSAEECFRDVLLAVVSQLQSVGWKEESTAYAEHAASWTTERYGATGDGDALTARLRAAVGNLLSAFPESLARECGPNATALKELQRDFRNLHNALNSTALESDWHLWKGLRSLRKTKRGAPMPDGYDELADAVIEAADALPGHPGPLAHAISHIEALLVAGQDVLVHYAEAKREAGLLDYSDMIAMAAEVLRDRPGVLDALAKRIDCLVVDEFQDTNPLQFSLLWQLKEAGVPTVIVGDLKQAIMGFQGADPRLFDALVQQNLEVTEPLTRNWRSQPRLMEFINAVSQGLFGDAYVSLEPQGGDSELDPLEVVSYPKKAKKGQHVICAAFVGQRLQELLEDQEQEVVDHRTKERRRIRGGDMAILCPTHNMLADYASVLRSQGLRVRIQEDGWYSSCVVQIIWHALAYIANPSDRHAALYLAVTELGSLGLDEALNQLMEQGHISEPLLEKLDQLVHGVADRTLYALVADTLSALNFFDVVAVWPDGEQARANILRLQAESGEFMKANREALANGGFHGSGVQSFLAWLDAKVEQKDKNNQPDPRVIDEDAIELVTWHSCKGREWPVVVVCGMDRKIAAKLPKMALGYSSFDDLSQLLDNAQIEHSPEFAAPETNDQFLADLEITAEIESRRLLYVAMTRARDKLVLEWPAYLAGKDGLTYWSILAGEVGISLDDGALTIGDATFPCIVTEGDSELPAGLDLDVKAIATMLPTIGRRAIRLGKVADTLIQDSVTPSRMEGTDAVDFESKLEIAKYCDGLDIEMNLKGMELGNFLHRCFEVLGANPALVDRLSTITGVELNEKNTESIANAVASFEGWLGQHFSAKSVARELPLLALDENKSVVSGTADLVVETDDGIWIIDHKSDQVDDPEAVFINYRPQLESYVKSLANAGEKVLGTGINWIRCGEVVLEAHLASSCVDRHGKRTEGG